MAWVINTDSISNSQIKADIREFLANAPDAAAWNLVMESGTGEILIDLLAGYAAYLRFNTILARRENYLPYNVNRSSAIAGAQDLGYSIDRGTNERLTLTVTPNITQLLTKYSVVGTVKDKDLILLEDTVVNNGVSINLNVAIGEVLEEELTVSSGEPTVFRFESPYVSEDFLLYLDTTELDTSDRLIDLLDNKFVCITNSLESIDVLYMNNEGAPVIYNTGDILKLQYIKLGDLDYISTDVEFDYGVLNSYVVNQNYVSPETTDQIKINAPLFHESQNLIRDRHDYSDTFKTLRSEIIDTNWTDVSAAIIKLVYLKDDLSIYSDSDKTTLISELSNFRPMGMEPPTITDPIQVPIKLDIDVTLLEEGDVETDIGAIIDDEEKTLKKELDFEALEYNIEELNYIKIARISITGDSWVANTGFSLKEYVVPSSGDLIMKATKIYRKSESTEPSWPTVVGETIDDGHIRWTTETILTPNPSAWQADTHYDINDYVMPTVPNGYMYKATQLNFSATINEIQKIEFDGTPASGTWRIHFDAEKTNDMAYNANAATVQSELEALTAIGVGNVIVTGDYTSGFTVLFINSEANTNQPEIEIEDEGTDEIQRISFDLEPDSGDWTITYDNGVDPPETTTNLAYNATSADVKNALEALSLIDEVIVTGTVVDDFVITFTGTIVGKSPQPQLSTTTIFLVEINTSVVTSVTEIVKGVSYYAGQNEVQRIDFNVIPADGSFSLTFNGYTTVLIPYNYSYVDTVKDALEALPSIGGVGGSVTVLGHPSSQYLTIEFGGALAKTDVNLLSVHTNTLSTLNLVTVTPIILNVGEDYYAGEDERQLLSFSAVPKFIGGGSFTLDFDGNITGSILSSASASDVQNALEALPNVVSGGVDLIVAGSFEVGFTIYFQAGGYFDKTNVPQIIPNSNSLVDISSNPISIIPSTLLEGAPAEGINAVHHIGFNNTPDYGSWAIRFNDGVDIETTALLAFNANAITIQAELEQLPNVTPGDLTVAGNYSSGFTITWVNKYLPDLLAFPINNLTTFGQIVNLSISTSQQGEPEEVAANEQQKIQFSHDPDAGTWQIEFDGQTTALLTHASNAAAVEYALEALSNIGVGNVSVSGDYVSGFTITFQGALAATDVALITIPVNTLTLSSAPVVITESTDTAGEYPALNLKTGTLVDINISVDTEVDALSVEPTWPTAEGTTVKDRDLLWVSVELNGTQSTWNPNTNYEIGDIVIAIDPVATGTENLMFQCIGFLGVTGSGSEPASFATAVIDDVIDDSDIQWTAKDPEVAPTQLSYNEYYLIDEQITAS